MKRLNVIRYFVLPTLVGLIATASVYWYVLPAQAEARVATVDVVVAKVAIGARTSLTADMLQTRPFPKDYLPQGVITSVKDAVGKVTIAPLAEGQMVVNATLAGPDNKTALAYHIPAGEQAITLPVNEITGIGGFVQVGDQVDVIATLPKDVAGADKATLLMQGLTVLAVGQNQSSQSDGRGSLTGYTSFTLAVTPRQAVLLTLAAAKGQIRFTLEPAVKSVNVGPITVTDADLGGQ